MNTSLSQAFELIKISFDAAKKFHKTLLPLNLLSLFVPISTILTSLFIIFWMTFIAPNSEQVLARIIILLSSAAITGFFMIWYGSHYLLQALQLVKGDKKIIPPNTSWKKLPGMLLVSLLQALAVLAIPLVMLIGASIIVASSETSTILEMARSQSGLLILVIALVVAALVYAFAFGVRLQFSAINFLRDGHRGIEALKQSWNMTRKPFWCIAWHCLTLLGAFFLISFIAAFFVALFGEGPAVNLLRFVVDALIQALIFIPVGMLFEVHLFNRYAQGHSAKT